MSAVGLNGQTTAADGGQPRPKRVRTGWYENLTCRERHLKCDEGWPQCQNCRKSSRTCKRGIRLNFIDIQIGKLPVSLPFESLDIQFQDESRDIASEYRGGLDRYNTVPPSPTAAPPPPPPPPPPLPPPPPPPMTPDDAFAFTMAQGMTAASVSQQPLPPIQPLLPQAYSDQAAADAMPDDLHSHSHSTDSSKYAAQQMPPSQPAYASQEQTAVRSDESREYLTSPDDVLFLQVFVEEVGLWMDTYDPMKHFSELLPFHSLNEPMLLNAFLACGAFHLSLLNPDIGEDRALHYYDTATGELLKSLQNPNRDSVICATTAVILNVFEVMSARAMQRMHHIAGARALIKECGWNARSTGIGAACFWLNVGLEVLSCLHFNWQVAWDPDTWGVDMDFTRETEASREEIWTYRVIYIVAKVANFRATIPHFHDRTPEDEQARLQKRYSEWLQLRRWCDAWNENIPLTMHPLAYVHPHQTRIKSSFPEVWLIKRTTIAARLFYHTAMCLLSQINPVITTGVEDMRQLQLMHAHHICGIVAHSKDKGIVAISIRSLAIAAESLVVREEQQEVIRIFDRIERETGWRIGFLSAELKQTWGWSEEQSALQQQQQQQHPQQQQAASMVPQPAATAFQSFPPPASSGQAGMSTVPSAPAAGPAAATEAAMAAEQRSRLRGIMNPLMATADFSMQPHPYQSYYVAPNPHPHPSMHASSQVSTSPEHHMLHVGAPPSSEHHQHHQHHQHQHHQQAQQGHPQHHSQHHQS